MTTAEQTATVGSHRPSTRRGLVVRPVVLLVVVGVLALWVSGQHLQQLEARNLAFDEVLRELLQMLALTVVCTVITALIAIPAGIAVSMSRSRTARLVGLGLGNLGQAIPSLGLIALVTIIIGVGFPTAVIALVAYAVLPVLRNTIVGLENVDPALTEAARGMGMTRRAVLVSVELPLAVPVILAGVRTAVVLTVATAPLAALVDAGGLGSGLFAGLTLGRPILSITFGILVAALALFFDWLGLLAEEFLRPKGI